MADQYWVVGSTWENKEEGLPQFIQRGYWYCWDAHKFHGETSGTGNSIKDQHARFGQVRIGDRLAIKKLLGQGTSDMSILALGIVKDVDMKEWRIYVDWVVTDIKGRLVPLNGCTASIHGPYSGSDAWVQAIFCL
jgi:hypothetical protein